MAVAIANGGICGWTPPYLICERLGTRDVDMFCSLYESVHAHNLPSEVAPGHAQYRELHAAYSRLSSQQTCTIFHSVTLGHRRNDSCGLLYRSSGRLQILKHTALSSHAVT